MSEVLTENNLNHLDLNGLEVALEKAVKEEDYEKAARIRDEISKRN
jgi:protein-arginine kinase activator protein McsA